MHEGFVCVGFFFCLFGFGCLRFCDFVGLFVFPKTQATKQPFKNQFSFPGGCEA